MEHKCGIYNMHCQVVKLHEIMKQKIKTYCETLSKESKEKLSNIDDIVELAQKLIKELKNGKKKSSY